MNALQRDKCFGRRMIASGGDFGITYATPAKSRSVVKSGLAAFPFVALIALLIVSAIH